MNMKDTQKSVLSKDANKIEELEKEISSLKENISQLANTIDAVEDEKALLTDNFKRALADYQNLEKNTQKRLGLMYLQSRKSLAEKLIPLIDDITMALKAKEDIEFGESEKSWVNGVEVIFNNLEKSLEEIGVKKYMPEKGMEFNPMLHEALTVIQSDKPGLIYDVIQPGYILEDTVIRPSRVVVTKTN